MWNLKFTHFVGTTKECVYPWTQKDSNKKRVFSLAKVPSSLKALIDASQDVGMVIGLFCICGGELILNADIGKGWETKNCRYHCPDCGARWE